MLSHAQKQKGSMLHNTIIAIDSPQEDMPHACNPYTYCMSGTSDLISAFYAGQRASRTTARQMKERMEISERKKERSERVNAVRTASRRRTTATSLSTLTAPTIITQRARMTLRMRRSLTMTMGKMKMRKRRAMRIVCNQCVS